VTSSSRPSYVTSSLVRNLDGSTVLQSAGSLLPWSQQQVSEGIYDGSGSTAGAVYGRGGGGGGYHSSTYVTSQQSRDLRSSMSSQRSPLLTHNAFSPPPQIYCHGGAVVPRHTLPCGCEAYLEDAPERCNECLNTSGSAADGTISGDCDSVGIGTPPAGREDRAASTDTGAASSSAGTVYFVLDSSQQKSATPTADRFGVLSSERSTLPRRLPAGGPSGGGYNDDVNDHYSLRSRSRRSDRVIVSNRPPPPHLVTYTQAPLPLSLGVNYATSVPQLVSDCRIVAVPPSSELLNTNPLGEQQPSTA